MVGKKCAQDTRNREGIGADQEASNYERCWEGDREVLRAGASCNGKIKENRENVGNLRSIGKKRELRAWPRGGLAHLAQLGLMASRMVQRRWCTIAEPVSVAFSIGRARTPSPLALQGAFEPRSGRGT